MFELVYNERRRWHLLAAAFSFFSILAQAQPFVPGQSYFGRSNYIEYIAGNLPVIISAPHGGSLTPAEMPNRTNATTVNDGNTQDLVRKVRTEIQNLTGHVPHIIINRLDRDKIDCNREIVEGAQGDPEAEIAWHEFQNFIIASRTNAVARHGHGFYIDLHGHGHDIQRLELGYLLSSGELGLSDGTLNSAFYENQSSVRTLSQQSPLTFPALLRGSNSFGALIVAEGYPAVPSPSDPDPDADPYFNGGYNTVEHGSVNGGTISGLQIESNYDGVRDTDANRTAYAQAIASVLEKYFALHYDLSLRECVPSVWDVGSGNWNTSGNWADGALPVSTNHIVFVGGGGNSTHNRSALTTGNGVLASLSFSNSVSGAYTLSGNAFSVLRGITNNSAFPHIINNHVTLVGSQTVAAVSGALTFGGNLTNGTLLRCFGDVTVNGVISGVGSLVKSGPGTLDLNAVNSYSGPTTNSAGLVSINSTSTFGNGNGLLVLAGGDILAENTRSGAPITNPLFLSGSSTISGDGTLTNSLRILPFSTDSISTTGGTLTIRHTGANAFASNNVFRVRFTGGGFNFTRPLTVGFISDLPSTFSQLESYNDDVSGDQIFSGTISGMGQLRRDAASAATAGRTILTAANNYSGGTVVNAGTLLVNNFFGSGTGSGLVVVSNNGSLGGTGIISGPVTCSGLISPGQSVGTLTVGGGLDFSAGGTNVWELSALTTVGEGSNFDQVLLNGGNLALGGSSKLQLSFTGAASVPIASEPFWLTSHSWKIISLGGGATNLGSTRFSSILNGNYATGSFTNFADGAGNSILTYVASPAPAPTIQSITANGTGQFTMAVGTATNRTYVLQYTTNLTAPTWMDTSTNVAMGILLNLTNLTGGDPMRFYRVRVMP